MSNQVPSIPFERFPVLQGRSALEEFRAIEDAVLASKHPVMEMTKQMLVDVLKAQYASVVDPEGEGDGLD